MRLALAILLVASAAVGQHIDSVDGEVVTGSLLTIHGNGFGSDNGFGHSPIFFEQWEDGGAAQNTFIEERNDRWVVSSNLNRPERPMYDEFTRSGRGFSCRWVSADTTLPYLEEWNHGNPSWPEHTLNRIWPEARRSHYGDRVFASWWFNCEFPGANASQGEFPQQWKMMHPFSHWESLDPRLGADPDGSTGWAQWTPLVGVKWQGSSATNVCDTPGILRFEPHNTKPTTVTSTVGIGGCSAAGSQTPYFPDRPAVDKPWSTWVQMEVYYQCSSGFNRDDAECHTWVSLTPPGRTESYARSTTGFADVVPGKNEKRTFHHAMTRLGLWVGKAGNGGYSPHSGYWDDIYVADTWAGIILADSDTWAETTIRERCSPTAWADDEITATVYTGGFADGEFVWLYVMDAGRNISNPFRVKVSSH